MATWPLSKIPSTEQDGGFNVMSMRENGSSLTGMTNVVAELHENIVQIICTIFYDKSMIVYCALNAFQFSLFTSWIFKKYFLLEVKQQTIHQSYSKFRKLLHIYKDKKEYSIDFMMSNHTYMYTACMGIRSTGFP